MDKLHMLHQAGSGDGIADKFHRYLVDAVKAIGDPAVNENEGALVLASLALGRATLAAHPPEGTLSAQPTDAEITTWVDSQKAATVTVAKVRTAEERSEAYAFLIYLRTIIGAAMIALREAKENDTDMPWLVSQLMEAAKVMAELRRETGDATETDDDIAARVDALLAGKLHKH